MKKINIILSICAMIFLSCTNDGGESKIELQDGAVANITKISTSDAFINLVNVNAGTNINLGLTVDKALGNIASVDVVGFYKKGATTDRAVLKSSITEFPTTVNFTQTDLINAFTSLNSTSDFQLGNSLVVSTEIKLTDGRIVKVIRDNGLDSFGSGIANLNTVPGKPIAVKQVYDVSCPSTLAGTYTYSTTNVNYTTTNLPGPYTGNVTLAGTGGLYTLTDASFGGWLGLYGPGNIATGVKLSDVCNKIKFSGPDQFGDTYTMSNLVIAGNKMTFNWINTYGESGTTELTKSNGNWPALFL